MSFSDPGDFCMDDDDLKTFLGWPNLGGVLTIVNGLLWIALTVVMQRHSEAVPEGVVIGAFLVLSLPLPLFCWMPGYTEGGILGQCILIGLNAFAWGYGLSWVWKNVLQPCAGYILLITGLIMAVLFWMYALTW